MLQVLKVVMRFVGTSGKAERQRNVKRRVSLGTASLLLGKGSLRGEVRICVREREEEVIL